MVKIFICSIRNSSCQSVTAYAWFWVVELSPSYPRTWLGRTANTWRGCPILWLFIGFGNSFSDTGWKCKPLKFSYPNFRCASFLVCGYIFLVYILDLNIYINLPLDKTNLDFYFHFLPLLFRKLIPVSYRLDLIIRWVLCGKAQAVILSVNQSVNFYQYNLSMCSLKVGKVCHTCHAGQENHSLTIYIFIVSIHASNQQSVMV